ncbi:hypothetical protein [Streptomyces blattellae]|uniref:hypothetical protein n=1 Tax=Streptomyces blattellae TaxID=2569855 RepID=UPI0012B7B513|nr:hypothetical protein [Streptomyces blattellae]
MGRGVVAGGSLAEAVAGARVELVRRRPRPAAQRRENVVAEEVRAAEAHRTELDDLVSPDGGVVGDDRADPCRR